MRVEVLKQMLPYGDRYRQVGDKFEMPDEHAKLFLTLGRVKRVEELQPARRGRRVYKRRDMVAEQEIPAVLVQAEQVAVSESQDSDADE